jgi:hypothetical protein
MLEDGMLKKRVAATAILLGLATSGVLAQKQVAFIATVVVPAGRDVTTVTPADVQVIEGGKAATISKVDVVQRTPKLQLLIDNGIGFPSSNLGDLRDGVKALIQSLPTNIEITIVTTAPNPRILEKATTDRVKQLSAIDRLTPDNGSGKFTESLYDATERIEKDKDETAQYTIVSLGTTQGDLQVRDDFIKKSIERIQKRHVPVFVVLFSTLRGSTTGGVQQDLGTAAANAAGGRIEVLNSATRLVTLLPELGKYLEMITGPNSHQLLVMVDRPQGGPIGEMGMQINGMNVVAMALDITRTK